MENNPLFSGNSSGSLNRLFNDRVKRAIRWANQPKEVRVRDSGKREKVKILGETDAGVKVDNWGDIGKSTKSYLVYQADSSTISPPIESIDFVVTDPPYYDNVQYSDLSAFFRVWLRIMFPKEVDWQYDPMKSAVSEGNGSGTEKYGEALAEIWTRCKESLKKESGRLIFTFHHWNPDAWAELTISLNTAGFVLVNRYVVFSENPISVHIMGLKSLKHDTILVLKPIPGKEAFHNWSKPSRIETIDSYSFCRDCGTALGWFLENDLSEENIRDEWKLLIGENSNGKISR